MLISLTSGFNPLFLLISLFLYFYSFAHLISHSLLLCINIKIMKYGFVILMYIQMMTC